MTSRLAEPDSIPRWSAARLALHVATAASFWALIAIVCLCVGSTGNIGWPADPVVRGLRLDVVMRSSLVGAALAAAGVVYQAILRNPLADPYLLGVSGGASLFAYIWRFSWAGVLGAGVIAAFSQQTLAFIGAMIAVSIVLVLSMRRGRLEPITLLLAGVILNAIAGAVFLLLYQLHPELTQGSGGPMQFLVGGIQTNLTRAQTLMTATIAGVGWIFLLYLVGQLNVAALQEAEAEALGIRIQRLRWSALIAASTVTAAVVCISGPIGFVGLICPHIGRRLFGADHRRLLPWATGLGAALLCLADAASRWLTAQNHLGTQLPVGVLTALLGGPFFLLLLWQSRREVRA